MISKRLLPMLPVCLAVACWQGAAALEDKSESPNHGRRIATVNPLSVARPARLLTKPGSSAGATGGTNAAGPAPVHKGAGRTRGGAGRADGERLFSEWPSALEELKQDAGAALESATARLERLSGYKFGELAERLQRLSGGKFRELAAWLGRLYRQVTAPPVVTPAGAPYIVDRYMHAPVYLTPEGRLKTVVSR